VRGFHVALVLGAFVCLISTANAALSSSLGGLAVYDDDLNITWLADADANNGRMTWLDANAWAASLTVGGFTDWRLPTTADPDASCTDTVFTQYPNPLKWTFTVALRPAGHDPFKIFAVITLIDPDTESVSYV